MKLNHLMLALTIAGALPQQLHAIGQTHEQVVRKEYVIDKGVSLKVENTQGNISIKTDPTQKTVLLKATKKSSKPEMLTAMRIKDVRSAQRLTITTEFAHENTKGTVEYVLIVPRTMNVELATDDGDISVNQLTGSIQAQTDNGNIKVSNSQGKVSANTGKGSITVQQTAGVLQLTTERGDIKVYDPNNTIIASTEVKGDIMIECSKPLPTLCKVKLSTKTGDIKLAMPKTTSADIYAHAERGTITSQQEITIKPMTIKLDQQAWDDIKHELKGTLGKGDTQMSLASTHGNIKLLVS